MTAPRSNYNRISDAEVLAGLHDADRTETQAARLKLAWLLECERRDLWINQGHRNFAEWVAARLKVSQWKARRMIAAARALPSLPHVDGAFEAGDLTHDHVLELCRFATPETDESLVRWARRVRPRAVKQRADVETKKSQQEAVDIDRSRFLHYWWMDDGRLGFEGAFPPEQGAVFAKAIDRAADRIPDILEEDESTTPSDVSLDIRRADALYAMASTRLAIDQDSDRATVVVHAELKTLANEGRGCEIENGPAVHAETARRMSCDGRIEFVLHNELGEVVGIGRKDRNPPPHILRALRHRDRGCTFPGCESKRFLHAHHIHHWSQGGPTDLDNLTLVCTFHHKLLHEYGWQVELIRGSTRWFRPGGRPYEPGRASQQQMLGVA